MAEGVIIRSLLTEIIISPPSNIQFQDHVEKINHVGLALTWGWLSRGAGSHLGGSHVLLGYEGGDEANLGG